MYKICGANIGILFQARNKFAEKIKKLFHKFMLPPLFLYYLQLKFGVVLFFFYLCSIIREQST